MCNIARHWALNVGRGCQAGKNCSVWIPAKAIAFRQWLVIRKSKGGICSQLTLSQPLFRENSSIRRIFTILSKFEVKRSLSSFSLFLLDFDFLFDDIHFSYNRRECFIRLVVEASRYLKNVEKMMNIESESKKSWLRFFFVSRRSSS